MMLMVSSEAVSELGLAISSFGPEPESLVPVAVNGAEVLNRHPVGAVRVRVPLALKSLATLSVITMLPRLVKDDAGAFWAMSAEMLVPPVAAVMLTAACAPEAPSQTNPRARRLTIQLALRMPPCRADLAREQSGGRDGGEQGAKGVGAHVPAPRVRPNSWGPAAAMLAAFPEQSINFTPNGIGTSWQKLSRSYLRARS
jgi:hypothetical protein